MNWIISTSYREGAISAIAKYGADEGVLDVVYYANPLGALSGLLGSLPPVFAKLQALSGKRSFTAAPDSKVCSVASGQEFIHATVRSLVADRFGISPRLMYWVKEQFDQEVSKRLPVFGDGCVLIGMWGSSAASFQRAGAGCLKVLNYVNSRPSVHNKLLRDLAGLGPSHPEMIPPRTADRVENEMARADLLLVPSRFVAEQMPEYRNKVEVIPYGVNPNMFSGRLAPQKPASAAAEPFTVLFLGQISHRKGVGILLEAAARLNSVHFRLVGPCVSRVLLQSLPKNVEYMGPVVHSQVPSIMRGSEAFVIPSVEDAYPLVTLEAMATGKPVIVSSNCGTSELISDRVNGLVFEAGSVNSLVSCIETLAADCELRHVIGNNARDVVESAHTWNHYGQRVFDRVSCALAVSRAG